MLLTIWILCGMDVRWVIIKRTKRNMIMRLYVIQTCKRSWPHIIQLFRQLVLLLPLRTLWFVDTFLGLTMNQGVFLPFRHSVCSTVGSAYLVKIMSEPKQFSSHLHIHFGTFVYSYKVYRCKLFAGLLRSSWNFAAHY